MKLYYLFANKIPLSPPLQKGELLNEDQFPSLKKRGQGRFWTSVNKDMNLRYVGHILLLFAALLVGFGSSVATAQELKRLRYGTTISTVNLPVWVAKESRLFAKYGLDPEVIMIQAGALTTLGDYQRGVAVLRRRRRVGSGSADQRRGYRPRGMSR